MDILKKGLKDLISIFVYAFSIFETYTATILSLHRQKAANDININFQKSRLWHNIFT